MRGPKRSGWWRGWVLGAAAVAWLLLGDSGARDGAGSGPGARLLRARVLAVTDGDTIVVRLRSGAVERVRYIGVDTPESTPDQPLECFGHEAAARNRELVSGRDLSLEPGPERRDDYGRLLAYVRAPGAFVNARLVAEGYARVLTIAPNDARAPLFERLQARAGRMGLGLWGSCPG